MHEEYAELKKQISELYSMHLEGELSEWASNFIEDMNKKFEKGWSFTERQVEKIEDLYEEYCE